MRRRVLMKMLGRGRGPRANCTVGSLAPSHWCFSIEGTVNHHSVHPFFLSFLQPPIHPHVLPPSHPSLHPSTSPSIHLLIHSLPFSPLPPSLPFVQHLLSAHHEPDLTLCAQGPFLQGPHILTKILNKQLAMREEDAGSGGPPGDSETGLCRPTSAKLSGGPWAGHPPQSHSLPGPTNNDTVSAPILQGEETPN